MTKEKLIERKKVLEAQKQGNLEEMKRRLATIKAIDGALQECDYWLKEVDHADTMEMIARLANTVEKETK